MVDYKECLFYDATPEIHRRAKELRKNMTETEHLLWEKIRNRKLNGLKFRRQHPISIFIADFYCHEIRLVIELDGGIHENTDQKEYDEGRTAELENLGISVIRFTNEEILNSIDNVLCNILNFVIHDLRSVTTFSSPPLTKITSHSNTSSRHSPQGEGGDNNC